MSELRNTTPKRPPRSDRGQPNAGPRRAAGAPSGPEKSPRTNRGQTPVPGPAGPAPDGGRAGRVRRTRGTAPASRGKAPDVRGGAPKARGAALHWTVQGAAASDDASGITGMDAASSAATPPARTACAAAAQLRDEGATPRVPGDALRSTVQGDAEELPPGETPLPNDGPAFVEAIHARADLFVVWEKLLNSTDVKVAQRAAERLVEIRFGKGPPPAEETETRVVWDARELTQDPQGREE